MDNEILVSVYITTLNRPELLDRALESLTRQTFKSFEVLICDDASDEIYHESYKRIISKYDSKFHVLKYIKNDLRKGACYSRNILINMSSARFITGLDDDDAFHPQRLELFINFWHAYSGNYSFICSGVNNLSYKSSIDTKDYHGKEINYDDMKNFNMVGNQIFIEKNKLLLVSGFDVNMPAWQDYDTWFRIIKKFGKAYKLDKTTMLLDTSEDRKRITTSSNAYNGYQCFIKKHTVELNADNLLSLKYIDLINRKQKFSVMNKDLLGKYRMQVMLLKYKSIYDFPILYKLYKKAFKK